VGLIVAMTGTSGLETWGSVAPVLASESSMTGESGTHWKLQSNTGREGGRKVPTVS